MPLFQLLPFCCYLFNFLAFVLYAQVFDRFACYYSHTHTDRERERQKRTYTYKQQILSRIFQSGNLCKYFGQNINKKKQHESPSQHELQSIRLNFMPNTNIISTIFSHSYIYAHKHIFHIMYHHIHIAYLVY